MTGRNQIRAAFEVVHRSGTRVLGSKTVRVDIDGQVAWGVQQVPTNMGDSLIMIALRHDNRRWLITSEAVVE